MNPLNERKCQPAWTLAVGGVSDENARRQDFTARFSDLGTLETYSERQGNPIVTMGTWTGEEDDGRG